MSEVILFTQKRTLAPLPQAAVTIRQATFADVPFIDSLQRKHTKAVGWMPTGQLEGSVKQNRVLIAEQVASCELLVASGEDVVPSSLTTSNQQLTTPTPVGYALASDGYFKRDDVGIIYQMNVEPGKQRSYVGAALLKAQFERSAYGCKLYCCWCAQDLAANKFWEAMGFVPLAFRTGAARVGNKAGGRIHIFWQKRIRSGDATTPWWFPSETAGGAVRENRLVLPIPPGTHWSDAKPTVLPGLPIGDEAAKALPGPRAPRVKKAKEPVISPMAIMSGGLRFASSAPAAPEAKAKREKAPKQKNDPKLVAAARELRDRWLEQVNATPLIGCGKYDVSRQIQRQRDAVEELPLLTAA